MLCLVDFRNLRGRSKVMRSSCLHNGEEYNSCFRDACLSIVTATRSSTIIFCLDGSPDYILRIHPTYKGTRKKEEPDPHALPEYPEELMVQDIREAARLYNKSVFFACSPHREADDVIAAIVKGVNDSIPEDIYSDKRLSWWGGMASFMNLTWVKRMFPLDRTSVG